MRDRFAASEPATCNSRIQLFNSQEKSQLPLAKTFNLFILKAPRERLEPKWLVKQRLESIKTGRCLGMWFSTFHKGAC